MPPGPVRSRSLMGGLSLLVLGALPWAQGCGCGHNASGGSPLHPPAPPSSLSAAASATDAVTLTWEEHDPGADAFLIEVAPQGGTSLLLPVAGSAATNGSAVAIVAALVPGTPYCFTVFALSRTGLRSDPSPKVCLTLPIPAGPAGPSGAGGGSGLPSAPTGLAATAGNARVSLQWRPATDASSYTLYRGTTSGGPYVSVVATAATAYVDTGLVNGTTYAYVVRGRNAVGESPDSNEASATPEPPPPPPGGLAAAPGDGQVLLSWSASVGATAYAVYRSTAPGGPYAFVGSALGTTFTDSGLADGTTYDYEVTAWNGMGESAPSPAVSATPLPPPLPPAGLAAAAANGKVALSWGASAGATGYAVARSIASGGPYAPLATTAGTSWTDATVVNGTTYFYEVSAWNGSGEGSPSGPVSATPLAPPPAPVGVAAFPGDASVTVTWGAVSGATGYVVAEATAPGGPYRDVRSTPATAAVVDGLLNGAAYFFEVAAWNALGPGGDSSPVSAIPNGAGACDPPAGDSVAVAWSSPPDHSSLGLDATYPVIVTVCERLSSIATGAVRLRILNQSGAPIAATSWAGVSSGVASPSLATSVFVGAATAFLYGYVELTDGSGGVLASDLLSWGVAGTDFVWFVGAVPAAGGAVTGGVPVAVTLTAAYGLAGTTAGTVTLAISDGVGFLPLAATGFAAATAPTTFVFQAVVTPSTCSTGLVATIDLTPQGGTTLTDRIAWPVTGGGCLTVAPRALNFCALDGGALPAPASVSITSTALGIGWFATGGVDWLSVAPTNATTPATAVVSITSTSLGASVTAAGLTVTSAADAATVGVTYEVIATDDVGVTAAQPSRGSSVTAGPFAYTVTASSFLDSDTSGWAEINFYDAGAITALLAASGFAPLARGAPYASGPSAAVGAGAGSVVFSGTVTAPSNDVVYGVVDLLNSLGVVQATDVVSWVNGTTTYVRSSSQTPPRGSPLGWGGGTISVTIPAPDVAVAGTLIGSSVYYQTFNELFVATSTPTPVCCPLLCSSSCTGFPKTFSVSVSPACPDDRVYVEVLLVPAVSVGGDTARDLLAYPLR